MYCSSGPTHHPPASSSIQPQVHLPAVIQQKKMTCVRLYLRESGVTPASIFRGAARADGRSTENPGFAHRLYYVCQTTNNIFIWGIRKNYQVANDPIMSSNIINISTGTGWGRTNLQAASPQEEARKGRHYRRAKIRNTGAPRLAASQRAKREPVCKTVGPAPSGQPEGRGAPRLAGK